MSVCASWVNNFRKFMKSLFLRGMLIFISYEGQVYLIQYQVFPLLSPEGLMILNHKFIRCYADVKCISFGPTLKVHAYVAK